MKHFVLIFMLSLSLGKQPATIWQVGVKDLSAAEFALAPDRYQEYLSRDFGWEDVFYLVGKSAPETVYRLSSVSSLCAGICRTCFSAVIIPYSVKYFKLLQ